MKILSLSALLLSGAVSLAAATPHDNERTNRVSYTKDTPPAVVDQPAGSWVEMTSPTPCAHGRTFVTVEDDVVAMSKLKISASKGRPVVKSVKIVFVDGSRRYVKIDRRIDPRKPAIIDLQGNKQIQHIVVDADWRVKGSYAIHGAPIAKSVATR